jgi:hypothetical protein
MTSKDNLKDRLLDISTDYFGPAAERFIDRQIATHLNKKPEDITNDDLAYLIDWLKLSFAMLTKDIGLVDEYVKRLNQIAKGDHT